MNKIFIAVLVIIVLFAGAIYWSKSLQSDDPTIISRTGIHWHPELKIYVKGEEVEIPEDLGLAGVHSPIHTHEDLPIIHLEFDGVVRQDDVKLERFFQVWRTDINSFGENMTMFVNGEPNSELGEYEMQDGDKIELRYE